MTIETAEKLIRSFESCARKRPDGTYEAYADPLSPLGLALQRERLWAAYILGRAEIPKRLSLLSGAPWTIGWGQTGKDIKPGVTWTFEECNDRGRVRLEQTYNKVVHLIQRSASPSQLAAMVSLAYNIGDEAFRKSSVLRLFNQGQTLGAADAFLMWVNAGGVKNVSGLVNRRKAERKFFLGETE